MVRGGRRPGNSGSREAILEAARAQFGQLGYEATTIRGIARAAGVDPALVHHFYGSKEQVFVAATQLPVDPAVLAETLVAGDLDGIGERLARAFLGLWENPATRPPLLALIRSAVSTEHGATMLREFITSAVLTRLAAASDQPEPTLRATLCGSQLVGLAWVRYIIRVEPLASADPDTVVAAIAPTLQRYLTGPLDLVAVSHRSRTAG